MIRWSWRSWELVMGMGVFWLRVGPVVIRNRRRVPA